jgi:nucleotide-binding universal stress UspA family protein
MTSVTVHQCFRCELRFPTEAELEDHLAVDHQVDLRHPVDPAPPTPVTHGRMTVAITPTGPAEGAADVAIAVAHQAGMAIELVEVDEPGFGAEALDRHLRAGADRARAHGATAVTTHRLARVEEGIAATLVDHLREQPPTLAAMLTRRRSATADVVLGSVSRPVVAGSPVPVLLSHPHQEIAERYTRVVVGVDTSELSERAVTPAADLAGRLGASLWVVQVLDPEMEPNVMPESSYVRRLARAVADRVPDVGYEVLHGPVRRSLARFGASEPGTILALGSHGRTGSRIGSLGSVSRDVVRRAECPVMIVGPAYQG